MGFVSRVLELKSLACELLLIMFLFVVAKVICCEILRQVIGFAQTGAK